MERSPPAESSALDSASGSYLEEALDLPFYHPAITTMTEVRELLTGYMKKDGFFLLRRSFSKCSSLTVSVVSNHAINHLNILEKESKIYFMNVKLFDSIKNLVNYYRNQEVPNREGFTGIYLRFPITDTKRHQFFTNSSEKIPRKVLTFHNEWHEERMERQSKPDHRSQVKPLSSSFQVNHFHRMEDSKLSSQRGREVPVAKMDVNISETKWNNLSLPRCSKPKLSCSAPMHNLTLPKRLSTEQQGKNGARTRTQPPFDVPCGIHNREVSRRDRSLPSTSTEPLVYCYARSENIELAPSLVEQLRQVDGQDEIKCSCGIYMDEAELPRGWSFHRSTEPDTYGRVMFTGPEGESTWNLPLEVSLELSTEQQDRIRELVFRLPTLTVNSSC